MVGFLTQWVFEILVALGVGGFALTMAYFKGRRQGSAKERARSQEAVKRVEDAMAEEVAKPRPTTKTVKRLKKGRF